jgi:hypothetical protein
MGNKYKIGDLVKCINNVGYYGCLTIDKCYKVLSVSENYIDILDNDEEVYTYSTFYFEPVSAEDSLKYNVQQLEQQLSGMTALQQQLEDAKEQLEQLQCTFEVGDKVVWTQGDGDLLVGNKVYTVERVLKGILSQRIIVEGTDWYSASFRKATQEEIEKDLAEKESILKNSIAEDQSQQINDAIVTLITLMKQEGSVKGYAYDGIEVYYAPKNGKINLIKTNTATSQFPMFRTEALAQQAIEKIGAERLIKMFRTFSGDLE